MKPLAMRENRTKGYLFTFCGLDGCGKTTMLTRLKTDLEKLYPVFLTKQPTNSVRQSDIFRTYMDCPNHDSYDYRSLSLLAASDRLQHVNKVIEPEMQRDKIVISDRYFYSCLANLRARGFVQDQWIYEIAQSVLKPDIAFFFDVPVETAVNRVRSRAEEKDRYIDMQLQYKLRNEYINICTANNGVLISTEMSVEESYALVKKQVERVLKMHIDEKVMMLLSEFSGKEAVKRSDDLRKVLSLDSSKISGLMWEIQEDFGIRLYESEISPFDLVTVQDVIDLVKNY